MNTGNAPPPAYLRIFFLLCVTAPLAYARYRAVTGWSGLGFHCPFRMITGLPCPFCFGTKSWILMMGGRYGQALAFNPLGAAIFVVAIFTGIWLLAALIFRLPELPITRWTEGNRFWFVVVLVVLANWIYSVVRFVLTD